MVTFRTLEQIQQLLANAPMITPQANLGEHTQGKRPTNHPERTLYLDGGSSYLKLGYWNTANQAFSVEQISWKNKQGLEAILKEYLNRQVDVMVASSVQVAPKDELNKIFQKLGQQYDFQVVWIDHASLEGLSLNIMYNPANSLGLDRLIAAYGVRVQGSKPVVVVDLGSAVTIDSISETHFDGGIIAPGFKAIQAGMQEMTPHLPIPLDQQTPDFPPKSTQNALWWGQYAFWVSGLEGIILEVAHATNAQKIILTGGDAEWFFEAMHQKSAVKETRDPIFNSDVGKLVNLAFNGIKVVLRPHLVLQGLRYLSRIKGD